MNSKLDGVASDTRIQHLIGNALCLDFANTLYGHTGTPIHEYLFHYHDLLIWSARVGILSPGQAEKLYRLSEQRPNEATAIFHRAVALREAIYRVFAALALKQVPLPADLDYLDAARSEALAHSHLRQTAGHFTVEWEPNTALDRILWPIALSAADLLTSARCTRVRQCSGETCDWLFVDTSRNHMRRWCSMRVCGNRTKARRFFERKRKRTTL